jgi:hypothetical protein
LAQTRWSNAISPSLYGLDRQSLTVWISCVQIPAIARRNRRVAQVLAARGIGFVHVSAHDRLQVIQFGNAALLQIQLFVELVSHVMTSFFVLLISKPPSIRNEGEKAIARPVPGPLKGSKRL